MDSSCILLADVGNTTCKLGLADEKGLLARVVLPTDSRMTSDSLGFQICAFLQRIPLSGRTIEAWVISSVVPHLNPIFRQAADIYGHCPVRFVPEDIPLPLENRYANPREVGADRLVTAYAARRLFSEPSLIIIDFGTATTLDAVQDNAYLGGLIFPGVLTSLRALGTQTAKLPYIHLEDAPPSLDFATDTRTSLHHGITFGFAAMIEGMSARMKRLLPEPTRVITTGGLGGLIAPLTDAIDSIRPDLLFDGLRMAHFAQTTAQERTL